MALFTQSEFQAIEARLASGQREELLEPLRELVASTEAHIDENLVTTPTTQYFSFASRFQQLTYVRIENDPRQIVVVDAPIDRMYSAYAYVLIGAGDIEGAVNAMKMAVRWNPMECAHRLTLAGLLMSTGDRDEYLKLSYSVFARASKSGHLCRAFMNFSQYFLEGSNVEAAAACIHAALRMVPMDSKANAAADAMVADHSIDPRMLDDAEVDATLAAEELPAGANLEVVVSALLLADICGAAGDEETVRDMVVIAVDLVGNQKAQALAQIVREQGELVYGAAGDEDADEGSDDDEGDYDVLAEMVSAEARATIDAATRVARSEDI